VRLHVEEAELEHREQADGSRPDDEHVGLDRFSQDRLRHASSASRVNAPILQGKAADRNYLWGCLASAEPQEKGGFRVAAASFRRALRARICCYQRADA